MDDEVSRSSLTDEEDYVDDNDNGEDYEGGFYFRILSVFYYFISATIEEEEQLDNGDYEDELRGMIIKNYLSLYCSSDLEDEGEMSIEELQRKYGYPPVGEAPSVDEEEGNDEVT